MACQGYRSKEVKQSNKKNENRNKTILVKKVKQLGEKEESKKTFPTINAYTVSHLCDKYITTLLFYFYLFFNWQSTCVWGVEMQSC